MKKLITRDPLVTYKDYEQHYGVSKKTAQRYLTQDRKSTGVMRFTRSVFLLLNKTEIDHNLLNGQ